MGMLLRKHLTTKVETPAVKAEETQKVVEVETAKKVEKKPQAKK